MSEIWDCLQPAERRRLERMAAEAGVPVGAGLIAALISAYLRLAVDAPGSLPRDPMRGVAVSADRALRKIGGAS